MTNHNPTTALFFWDVRDELQDYLQEGLKDYSEVELLFPEQTDEETLLSLAPQADILVGWRPSEKLLATAENLGLFINPGAGVQHLTDLFRKVTQDRDITLVNGHGNSYFTAQHAVALLLALTNKVVPHHNWLVAKKWRKRDADAKSIPLRNRKIGLLGYGAVNQKVHRFLSGFNVAFHVLKRSWDRKRVEKYPTTITKYTPDKLSAFLKVIDVLIIAVPLTSETEGLIGEKEFQLLGSDSFIVNMSRGQVIQEKAFYQALKNNHIAGAAIDVWYNYRPEPDPDGGKFPSKYPFYELDNVVLSPHRGASPMDDLKRWDEVIENISRYARGEKEFLNEVNLELEY
ncbi:MAG: NAD(P)-dependent oxidoreductase [Asgard group archaeon]|nr:NAD(P)-dependent oxidoreductase [Asgard group archaeon]